MLLACLGMLHIPVCIAADTIDGLGGTDTVTAVGTAGADVYVVSGGSLTINGSQLSLMRVENRTLAGLSGSDTYRSDTDTQLGNLT